MEVLKAIKMEVSNELFFEIMLERGYFYDDDRPISIDISKEALQKIASVCKPTDKFNNEVQKIVAQIKENNIDILIVNEN